MALSMKEYVTEWTPQILQTYKVELVWRTREQFFGPDNNPRAVFDHSILDEYPPDNPTCSVEAIHFYIHSESYREDEDSMGDYAFGLLWFCGYIVPPRFTCRNILGTYSSGHQAKPCKYTLSLQGGYQTVMFVTVADSVQEGLPRVLAGLISMHSEYVGAPIKRKYYPCILLVRRLVIFIKVQFDDQHVAAISFGDIPEGPTHIEAYTALRSQPNYKRHQLPVLFDDMEAFKKLL